MRLQPLSLSRRAPGELSRRGFGPSSHAGPALAAIPPTAGYAVWGWAGLVLAGLALLALGLLAVGGGR